MVQRVGVDLEKLARLTGRSLETFILEFGQDMAEEALRNTPVDTGFLRASWFVSINSQSGGNKVVAESEKTTAPKGTVPPSTAGRMNLEIAVAEPGDILYFLNGAAYAEAVEYGLGPGTRTPQPFVRQTVADAQKIANRTVERIRRAPGSRGGVKR